MSLSWFTAIYFMPSSGPARYLTLQASNRSEAINKFNRGYPDYMLVSLQLGQGVRPNYERVRV